MAMLWSMNLLRLLVEEIGDRQITNKKSMFAEMVKSTGASMAKKIFEVARDQFYLNRDQFFT